MHSRDHIDSFRVFQKLLAARKEKGAGFLLLVDPDKYAIADLLRLVELATSCGADAILIGGSVMLSHRLDDYIQQIKLVTTLPVILFPGSVMQVSREADAILFLSLVSGRNPELLIGGHVVVSPVIKAYNLEAISTAYMLVESGRQTSASFISNTMPLPRHKPDIAAVHALAAEYMGMKTVYLEAGSGADQSVPEEMIAAVRKTVEMPIIVGGGIRTPTEAYAKVKAGADFVVVGNAFEARRDEHYLREMIDAVHTKLPKTDSFRVI